MTNKLKMASALLAMVMVLALAACSNGKSEQPATGQAPTKTGQNETANKPEDQPKEMVMKEGTGTFTGLADPHTVEIIMDGNPAAFQLGEGMDQAVAGLQKNDNVSFKYEEKTGLGDSAAKQLVLTEITKAASGGASGSGDSAAKERPKTGKLEVTLEGNTEQRTASLVKGEGYSFYIPEQFTFDSKAGLLYMNIDKNYAVRIEKLPSDSNLEDLETKGRKKLEPHGKVTKLIGEEINPLMRDAKLFLLSSGKSATYEYIVKELDGSRFIFHVDMPQGEPSEGFGPLAFAALNTIENE
ncbi:hypothetical protein EJP77_12615 [Paenibacillus zeisoli]|uniref:Lipoprotein n=1 Tax=Paenibacillus zeisoli TaxID=2496267 RepID=A0A433X933_9BACL|nr:hypothetical protein [Paenibacillus zeisoli]RUT30657.1 hypothetical protein EJP77_12615 [Paenibacillus zeisoli]